MLFFEEVAVCWMINTGVLGRNQYLLWLAQFHKELSMAEKM